MQRNANDQELIDLLAAADRFVFVVGRLCQRRFHCAAAIVNGAGHQPSYQKRAGRICGSKRRSHQLAYERHFRFLGRTTAYLKGGLPHFR